MAVHWLDLARYADSVGYHSDVAINVYPYRDYVIRAFNENMPFDRFTREQLAGDLLPDPTDSQIVASAFNRLGRMTNEGGAQEKEYLVRYAADRVRTVANGLARLDDDLRRMPRPQVRPLLAEGLLPARGVLRGHRGRRRLRRPRQVGADGARAARRSEGRGRLARQDSWPSCDGQDGALADSKKNRRALEKYVRKNASAWKYLEPIKAWDDCGHPDFNDCDRIDFTVDGSSSVGGQGPRLGEEGQQGDPARGRAAAAHGRRRR